MIHYKDLGGLAQEVGVVSERTLRSDPLRLKDLVRVRVTLSRPAYGYLIALNTNGKDQLCRPVADRSPDTPGRELDFPEDPKGYFGLTDGIGIQAFVLVVSDRPLPAYDAWKSQVPGGLAWSPPAGDALWTYDDPPASEPARRRGQFRGDIVRREGVRRLDGPLRPAPQIPRRRRGARRGLPGQADQEIMK